MFNQPATTNTNLIENAPKNSYISQLSKIIKTVSSSGSDDFSFIFYDKSPYPLTETLEKPSDISNDLWREGILHNPNPSDYFPSVVKGIDGLQARCNQQKEALTVNKVRLFDIQTNLKDVMEIHKNISSEYTQLFIENMTTLISQLAKISSYIYSKLYRRIPLKTSELAEWEGKIEAMAERKEKVRRLSEIQGGRENDKEMMVVENEDIDNETKKELLSVLEECNNTASKLLKKVEEQRIISRFIDNRVRNYK